MMYSVKNCGMDMNALMFEYSSVDLLHATKKKISTRNSTNVGFELF